MLLLLSQREKMGFCSVWHAEKGICFLRGFGKKDRSDFGTCSGHKELERADVSCPLRQGGQGFSLLSELHCFLGACCVGVCIPQGRTSQPSLWVRMVPRTAWAVSGGYRPPTAAAVEQSTSVYIHCTWVYSEPVFASYILHCSKYQCKISILRHF